jgi:glycosyltransferase involved in cell wall biosynthesis
MQGVEYPLVSIVVPTHDRKIHLRAALESLARLDYPKDCYEVIVVDDGSTDGSDQVVRDAMGANAMQISYCRQQHTGVTAARNRALQAARGSFVALTDDDCTFPSSWLQLLLEQMDSASVGAVGGPDLAPVDASLFVRCVDYSVTSFAGTGGVRRKEKRAVGSYYPRGCNIMVSKAALDRIGRFDPTLTAGEEIELGYRLKQAGYVLKYAPEAFVWHHRRDSWKAFTRQMFARGMTRVELIRRHSGLFEWSYLIPALLVLCILTGSLLTLSGAIPPIVFFPCAAFYLLALLTGGLHGAIKIRKLRALFLISAVLFLQHSLYGLGFLAEALHPRRKIPGYS